MIRAVLDTNVFISALFWKGTPYELMQQGFNGVFVILASPSILEEIKSTLIEKFEYRLEDTDEFIQIITVNSEIVEPNLRLDVVKDDPSDNKIIECAVEGKASHIVSGDQHLLKLKQHEGIQIISPQEFLQTIRNK